MGRCITRLAVLAILVAPSSAAAATRYVDDSGSDAGSNPCTSPSTPCRTLGHALDAGDSTDTYAVGGGVYNENVVVGGSASLVARNFQPPATAGAPVIDGGPGVAIVSSTTGAIDGLTVRGDQDAIRVTAGAPTISHDTFDDTHENTQGRVRVESAGAAVVDHDAFTAPVGVNMDTGFFAQTKHAVRVSSSTFTHEAIAVENDGDNVLTVRGNAIAVHGEPGNSFGVGIFIQNGAATVAGNRIVAESPGPTEGLSVTSFRAVAARANRISGMTHWGAEFFTPGHTATMQDDVVVGNNTGGKAVGVSAGGSTVLQLTNETIVGNAGASQVSAAAPVAVDSSIVGDGGIDAPSCTIAFSHGPTTAGSSCQRFQTAADPQFVGGADFHLRPSSPLVDAGNPAPPAVGTDADGKPRVRDGNGDCRARRDMGAYELQSGPCVHPKCTLRLRSRKVAVRGKSRGRVRVVAQCDQGVLAGVGGRVKVARARKKATSTAFKTRKALLKRGRARTVTFKLPKPALSGLRAGAKVSVRFSLFAKNARGAPGGAKVGYKRLRLKR